MLQDGYRIRPQRGTAPWQALKTAKTPSSENTPTIKRLLFKVEARTCKLLGLWAAKQLERDNADAYAKEIVSLHTEKAGFDHVKSRILKDFAAKGLKVSGHVFDRELEKFLAEAKTQIIMKQTEVIALDRCAPCQ